MEDNRHAAARRSGERSAIEKQSRRWPVGTVALAMLSLTVADEHALASGYALREQSVSALGNAFAGATAGAEDLSYMFFNPAALTRQSGSQLLGAASAIIPQLEFHDGRASTAAGTSISGNEGGRNVGENGIAPVLYGMWDVQQSLGSDQNVKLGLGVNVPFGVETDYRDDWIGRYHALHSRVMAVNVNPAVAWEVVEGLSIAAGLQVQYFEARLTNAVDFGSIGQAVGVGGVPTQQDGIARAEGDDFGYGFNLGILFEPWQGTRFGAAYRSDVHHTLRGDGDFKLDAAGTGQRLVDATGFFQDTPIKANLTTPETASFGVYHDISPEWAVMGEAAWTRWSRFRDLTIKFDNPAQPNNVTEQDWRDTWFFAVGLTWRPNERWTLRGGAAFDQDPTRERTRTPRLPTDDRYWLSLGVGYRPFENLRFNFGYTHVFIEDASIDLTASQPGNQFRGNLSGDVEGAVDIFGLQASWVF
jgi:long-chain fatty acid transport protein